MQRATDQTLEDLTRTLLVGTTPVLRMARDLGWDFAGDYRKDLDIVRRTWRTEKYDESGTMSLTRVGEESFAEFIARNARHRYDVDGDTRREHGVTSVIEAAFDYLEKRRERIQDLPVEGPSILVSYAPGYMQLQVRELGGIPKILHTSTLYIERERSHLAVVPQLLGRMLTLCYPYSADMAEMPSSPEAMEAALALWDPTKRRYEKLGNLQGVIDAAQLITR